MKSISKKWRLWFVAILAFVLLILGGCSGSGGAASENNSASTEAAGTMDVGSMLSVVREKRAEESRKKEAAKATEPADETELVTVTADEAEPAPNTDSESESSFERDYVLNTNTMKFHYPSCKSVGDIKDYNREDFHGTREEVISRGFEPCGRCKP